MKVEGEGAKYLVDYSPNFGDNAHNLMYMNAIGVSYRFDNGIRNTNNVITTSKVDRLTR